MSTMNVQPVTDLEIWQRFNYLENSIHQLSYNYTNPKSSSRNSNPYGFNPAEDDDRRIAAQNLIARALFTFVDREMTGRAENTEATSCKVIRDSCDQLFQRLEPKCNVDDAAKEECKANLEKLYKKGRDFAEAMLSQGTATPWKFDLSNFHLQRAYKLPVCPSLRKGSKLEPEKWEYINIKKGSTIKRVLLGQYSARYQDPRPKRTSSWSTRIKPSEDQHEKSKQMIETDTSRAFLVILHIIDAFIYMLLLLRQWTEQKSKEVPAVDKRKQDTSRGYLHLSSAYRSYFKDIESYKYVEEIVLKIIKHAQRSGEANKLLNMETGGVARENSTPDSYRYERAGRNETVEGMTESE